MDTHSLTELPQSDKLWQPDPSRPRSLREALDALPPPVPYVRFAPARSRGKHWTWKERADRIEKSLKRGKGTAVSPQVGTVVGQTL